MPGFYQSFTSARATEPDPTTLLAQLRALDVSAGVQHALGSPTYILKKATAWTGPAISAAQGVIDAAPASSPQLTAQANILRWPIEFQALALSLVDVLNDHQHQINAIRASLPNPPGDRADITGTQALTAVSAKAGTL